MKRIIEYWRRKPTSSGMCVCPMCGRTAKQPSKGAPDYYTHSEISTYGLKMPFKMCVNPTP